MTTFATAVVLTAVLAAGTQAQETDGRNEVSTRPRVAVLDFGNQAALPMAEIDYVTDLVRGAVRRELPLQSYIVMTRDNIFDLLPVGTDLAHCIGECAVQTGRNIGADYVITGDVLEVGGQLRVKFTLYGTADGNLMEYGVVRGEDTADVESQLEPEVGLLVSQIRLRHRITGDVFVYSDGDTLWTPPGRGDVVVIFDSRPGGATVEINGMPECTTPTSWLLPPGRHEIAMKKPRYLPEVRNVLVDHGMEPVSWALQPNFGLVSVETEPPGLPVIIDGWNQGVSPLAEFPLDPGVHRVEVTGSAYHRTGQQIVIERGDHHQLLLEPVPRRGGLIIRTVDENGEVLRGQVIVGDEQVGWTYEQIPVLIGDHDLRVATDGGCWTGGVRIFEGQLEEIEAVVHANGGDTPGSRELVALAEADYRQRLSRAETWKDRGSTAMIWGAVGGLTMQALNNSAKKKEATIDDCDLSSGECATLPQPALSSSTARTLRNVSWGAAAIGLVMNLAGRTMMPDSLEETIEEWQRRYPCAVDLSSEEVRVSLGVAF